MQENTKLFVYRFRMSVLMNVIWINVNSVKRFFCVFSTNYYGHWYHQTSEFIGLLQHRVCVCFYTLSFSLHLYIVARKCPTLRRGNVRGM